MDRLAENLHFQFVEYMLNKIWDNRWILRSLLQSVYFNFRYLPMRQAWKLPILFYKPKKLKCTGKFEFNCPIKFGMIKLGVNLVSIYPDSGIKFENKGKIIFNGKLTIGNNSAISVGKSGTLTFGDDVLATCSLKLACYNSITFEDNVLIGWDCLFIDTDFHKLTSIRPCPGKAYGPIHVGHNTWIATGCKLYKNATVPPECVVGADTILHKPVGCAPKSLISNEHKTIVHSTPVYLDKTQAEIIYSN